MVGRSDSVTEAPAGKTVLASSVAKIYTGEIKKGIEALGRKPKLVGFLANTDPAARMYADWTGKTCQETGFDFELREVDKEELEDAIFQANEDDAVDGIMIYFPVFGNRQDQYLQQVVSKDKDVEGLSHIYIQNLYHNTRYLDSEQTKKSILPCTPLALVKILEYLGVYNMLLPYGNRLYGKTVTIVNRSEIVGRPLAALLANDGAVVYSFDIDGVQMFNRGDGIKLRRHRVADVEIKLEEAARLSDVIITGVPSESYKFPTESIKDGAVCVNFSTAKNFDPSVKTKAALYVPSIGKVTITMLMRNLLRLIDNKAKTVASA
ncbi:tetrahydrofolate dehydrogenase/cyclohydrolase [Myxozyma melibiosi]|uniref:Tetrahydrofolate dehydrogenase/cyclohydrolase n=1 Tax=Myxozyma melibiosi TaxID=54550 RepID=A0ABR1F478_9ASCO